MKRKVIQIADSTQLVSLPRKWARQQGIKKGDELDVEMQGSKLYITTQNSVVGEKTSMEISTPEKFLRRYIDVLYRDGFDEIDIKFNDPQVIEMISEVVENLLGFEVVNQGRNYCTIKNIAAGLEAEFDNLLRRLFMMIISMIGDMHHALLKNDFKTLSKIAHFDHTINKFTNFCERLLNKKGFKDHKKTSFIYYIVCTLEQLADEYNDMLTYVAEHKMKLSKGCLELYNRTKIYFEAFYKLFYNFNREGLYSMKQLRVQLKKDLLNAMETKKGKEIVVLQHLFSVVNFTQHMATGLA